MRELTQEIKQKIRNIAIDRLQDNNALVVLNKDEVDSYIQILESLYINNEMEIE